MIKGAILEKDGQDHTYLRKIFRSLGNFQKRYNWLISDCEACPKSMKHYIRLFQSNNHTWISGEELTGILRKDDIHWIWAVLSGFEPKISHEEVLQYPLPYADGNGGFWNEQLSIQHPLASVEIVAWDGTCTMLISKTESLIEDLLKIYPLAKDLEEYNRKVNSNIDEYERYEAYWRSHL